MKKAEFLELLDEYQRRQSLVVFFDWDKKNKKIIKKGDKKIGKFNIFDTFLNSKLGIYKADIPREVLKDWKQKQLKFIKHLT